MLAGRLFVLTVVQGERHSERAEERLDTERFLPTWRGRLLDRNGRVIAEDVASYDAAVSYSFAKGTWATERAEEEARQALGKAKWRLLKKDERERAIAERLPKWRAEQARVVAALASRGGLPPDALQSRLAEIATRIDTTAASVHARTLAKRKERGLSLDVAAEPIREMREFHAVVSNVPPETANEFRKLSDQCPGGLIVIDAARRNNAWATVDIEIARDQLPRPIRTSVPLVMRMSDPLDSLRGSVRREVWAEDERRRPFERTLADGSVEIDLGGYRAGSDSIGARGFERRFEDELRGNRGQVSRRLDTDTEDRIEPKPGADVRVSIDAELQACVQAALDPRLGLTKVQSWQSHSSDLHPGEALPAAAVIVEVDSGEVLAAASTPTPEIVAASGTFVISANTANLNRALDGIYPPGSIVKPLVYLAGVAEGVVDESETIACNGHYFKDRKDVARCWIYRQQYKFATHSAPSGGPLAVENAIAYSCNIYFYTVAERLGAQRLCEWFTRFGLGANGGHVPSPAEAKAIDDRHDVFSTISLGIGQGALTVTPLELASAFAVIARGGRVLPPAWRRGENLGREAASESGRLPLFTTAVARTLEGLRRVTADPKGTANHMTYPDGARDPIIDVPGVRLWAKTGTAEAPPLKLDRDHDGTPESIATDADHAWCVALVGDDLSPGPRYAIAVLIEHGGGGGRTSGPVMAAVIRALVKQGYLGPRSGSPAIGVGAVR